MENRLFNFSPGPAILPLEVLEIVQQNLINYRGSGIGILEMSHRSPLFQEIIEEAEAVLRSLLSISDEYAVLFCTGGATMQFSMVPLNLLEPGGAAEYLITGIWAKKAFEEARKFGNPRIAASSEDRRFSYVPKSVQVSPGSRYLHFTSNNTVYGTQFRTEPDAGGLPLVCDASSDFLSRRIDINKYSLLYAGAQKNIGPAGVTVVIIRRDLVGRAAANVPIMLDYRTYMEHGSLYNTPPTFAIYVVAEVLKWIQRTGLDAVERRNEEKAKLLYDMLDASSLYQPVVEPEDRSLMNVTFRLTRPELEAAFIKGAETRGFKELKGHRSIGGIRVSIYNAFPVEGVRALAEFMREFEAAA